MEAASILASILEARHVFQSDGPVRQAKKPIADPSCWGGRDAFLAFATVAYTNE